MMRQIEEAVIAEAGLPSEVHVPSSRRSRERLPFPRLHRRSKHHCARILRKPEVCVLVDDDNLNLAGAKCKTVLVRGGRGLGPVEARSTLEALGLLASNSSDESPEL